MGLSMAAVKKTVPLSAGNNSKTGNILTSGSLNRIDGWENLFTGMGIKNRDRKVSTTFGQNDLLTEPELNALYTDDGIATRIVDLLPDEMLREGWTVDGDSEGLINGKLDELNAVKHIEMLLKWNRLHGGAILVMGLDDGTGDMAEPLREDQLRDIIFMRVYSRWRISWTPVDLYQDPMNPKYGEIEKYYISPAGGGAPFYVHESRCIILKGKDAPELVIQANNGWGTSELQRCFASLRSLGNVYNGTESIIEDFISSVMSIENLQDMIYSGNEDIVKKRLEILDLSRHILNTMLLDTRETYTKQSSSVTGLPDLVEKFWEHLSVDTGIPLRILKGQQKGGLNNKGEGETEDWYNLVQSKQITELKPILERVFHYIFKSKKGPFRGNEPENWQTVFNPLWQLTEKEEAEVEKIRSETDAVYIANGVYTPEEVAISRFGGERYGKRIELAYERDEPTGEVEPSEDDMIDGAQNANDYYDDAE